MVEALFVGAIFDFDTNGPRVAGIPKHRKEVAPIDIPKSREFGKVVQVWMGKNSVLVEEMLIDSDIFRVNVKNAIDEIADGLEVVHVLEHHMRWVVVEPQIWTRQIRE